MEKGTLDGKTAIITGAGSGIGKATSLMFVEEGAEVMAVDLYEDRLAKLETEVATRVDTAAERLLTIRADVSDYDAAGSVIRQTVEGFGKLDILVNNAGGSMGFGGTPFVELEREKWDLTLGTNLYTTFNCTQHALRQMIPHKSGAIVNLGSTQGLGDSNVGGNLFAVYAAAKAGIIEFTKAIAREVAPYRIRVNCVSPGLIKTGFFDKVSPEFIATMVEKTPWKRWGEPEEIARVILFYVADESDYITGQNICVSGGQVMH